MLRAGLSRRMPGLPGSRALSRGRATVALSTYSLPTEDAEEAPIMVASPNGGARPVLASQEQALKSLVDNLLAKQTFAPRKHHDFEPIWKKRIGGTTEVSSNSLPPLPASSHPIVGVQGTSGEQLTSVTTKSYVSGTEMDHVSLPYEEGFNFDEDVDVDEALVNAAAPPAALNTTAPVSAVPDFEDEKKAASESREKVETDSPPAESPVSPSSSPRARQCDVPPIHHPLVSTLFRFVKHRNTPQALTAFYDLMGVIRQARRNRQEPPVPPSGLMKALFYMVSRRPFDAHQVLLYYMTLPNTIEFGRDCGNINAYAPLWRRLCDSMRHMDPEKHSLHDIETLVRAVSAKIKRTERPAQELCCPVLVSALIEQRSVQVGYEFAEPIYSYMMREEFDVPDGWFVHVLTFSKYNRQYDLPYDDVLMRCVARGRRPPPVVVLNALDNFFPFTDTAPVTRMLQAILQLQQEVVSAAASEGRAVDPKEQYTVDIGTLEMIGAAAASQGSSDVNLLVWDMLDVLGYEPTVGIYENTVVAFAMNTFTYKEVFTVLAEMEASGFEPSRALIRSCSTHLRNSTGNLEFALEQLLVVRQEGKAVTTAALNCIISGAAERGDVDRVLSLWTEFERNDLVPNSESYGFAFESLGKHLRRKQQRRSYNTDQIDACITTADAFLAKMEEQGLSPSQHVIREYVEFLCLVREVDTATAIVLETLQKGEDHLISDKTIYRVAMANAKLQQFDVARKVSCSRSGAEPIEFLLANIEREERALLGMYRDVDEAAAPPAEYGPAVPKAANFDTAPAINGPDDY